jgi:hypothetical protein
MSELSYHDGIEEPTGTDVSSRAEPTDPARRFDHGEPRLDPASSGRPTERPLDGSVGPAAGPEGVASEDAPDGGLSSADGAEPARTSARDVGSASNGLVSNGESFRVRWSSVQVGFVDDPRRAVEEAEQLVTDVIADLVEGFRRRRLELEGDGSGSTDEMRSAFQGYRDFFDRLLNV